MIHLANDLIVCATFSLSILLQLQMDGNTLCFAHIVVVIGIQYIYLNRAHFYTYWD